MSVDADSAVHSRAGVADAGASASPSASRRARSRWKIEIVGGFTIAIVSFSVSAPVGTLAVAPLGPGYTGLGVVIGLSAAIFGGLVAALAGRSPAFKTGPITATCLVFTAALSNALATSAPRGGDAIAHALALACLCVMLAGAIQVAMGMLRLGSAIKFVPYPVVAGFRNGIAVSILLSQVPVLLETGTSLRAITWTTLLDGARAVNVGVGAIVVIVMWTLRTTVLRSIAPFVAILAGTLAHYAFGALWGASTGPLVGALPAYGVWFEQLLEATPELHGHALASDLLMLLPHAASIAIVGSLFALLAARVVDQATHGRHDGNRELVAQGLGNVASGGLGGIPVSVVPSQSLIAWHAGAGGRLSTLVACLLQLAVLQFAAHWIALIPAAALAGVMILTAFDLFDEWSLRLFANLRRIDTHRRTVGAELGVVLLVTGVIVAGQLIVAVVVGIVITAIVFISRMSHRVIRSQSTGRLRHSRRRRRESAMEHLRNVGHGIALFELEGPLFFGTADRLATDVEAFAGRASYVILDFRRVNAIDATGARILHQLARTLDRRGARLLFSSIAPTDPNRHLLRDAGALSAARVPSWFPDIDHALEWCEDRLLEQAHASDATAEDEIAFARTDFCEGLDARERAQLAQAMLRRMHPAGSSLFRRGDPGDELYVLLKGALSLTVPSPHEAMPARRLLTLRAGVTFGEMALLEGKPRTANATFDADSITMALSRERFDALARAHPALVNKLLLTLGRILSSHLRTTTEELRETER